MMRKTVETPIIIRGKEYVMRTKKAFLMKATTIILLNDKPLYSIHYYKKVSNEMVFDTVHPMLCEIIAYPDNRELYDFADRMAWLVGFVNMTYPLIQRYIAY